MIETNYQIYIIFYTSKKVSQFYIEEVEDSYELDSDHSPVIMTFSDQMIQKEANHTDWEALNGIWKKKQCNECSSDDHATNSREEKYKHCGIDTGGGPQHYPEGDW